MVAPARHPDAWHRVTAPGGYEWWYFDAESADGRTQLVAIFFEGFVFHPGYLRQYARFRRRPTRVAPPVASDYPCAYFVVYRDGRLRHQFMTRYRPDQFAASDASPQVSIGRNTLRRRADGAYELSLAGAPWKLTGRGPRTLTDQTLRAELVFRPSFEHDPVERPFLSREMSGAEHRWILAAPRCQVAGTIQCGPAKPESFEGLGYHDHNFGTAPIGPGLRRWLWGRMLTDDGVVAFHHARARDAALPDELHAIACDAGGTRELPTEDWKPPRWGRRTSQLLAYPHEISFGSALRLSNPRVIDSAPFYMRLICDASFEGHLGKAFCEVAYPHRLRWPVLGRMIEMSIDERELDQPPTQSAG